jgi:hypothetical protein
VRLILLLLTCRNLWHVRKSINGNHTGRTVQFDKSDFVFRRHKPTVRHNKHQHRTAFESWILSSVYKWLYRNDSFWSWKS